MFHVSRKKGFTLIEILVATTIIAVLAAIGMVSYSSATVKSRDAKRKADMEQIRAALEMYRTDNNVYLDTSSGQNLNTLVSDYLPKVPIGPKNDSYSYSGSDLYSYCVCADLEKPNATCDTNSTCACSVGFNYCLKNP